MLLTRIDKYHHYTNDLTREMDSYIAHEISSFKNYIYDGKDENDGFYFYPIRYPGATRGHIKVDNKNIIKEIILYEDTKHIYKSDVEKIFEKYLGEELFIEGGKHE